MPEAQTRKRKILVVGAFPPAGSKIFGGVVTTCRSLINSSFADHYELTLLDTTQISNPPPTLPIRAFFAFTRFCEFIRNLFLGKFDAVVLFSSSGTSLLEKGGMAWLSRLTKVPVLLFPRSAGIIQVAERSLFHRLWITSSMKGATHILCQGPAWQRFATQVLNYPIAKTPIIHNWTATNRLLAIGESRILKARIDIKTILFLGWLEKRKGIFELLEACRELRSTCRFKLVIAGRGHAEEETRQIVDAYGLGEIVTFCGWVEGEQKDTLLAQSDILVLPSWAEGFPNVVIEAMAAKMSVVATLVGNLPDIIQDGQQALLVPPKDSSALKNAIEQLLNDSSLRIRLANAGHNFARDTFSVERGVNALITVIDAAIFEKKAL